MDVSQGNNGPKLQNATDTSDACLENKMSHSDLCVFIIISDIYIYIYISHDKCSEDQRREYRFAMRNLETLKKLSGLKLCYF